MTEYKVIINLFAQIDIEEATEWYNLKSKGLGNKFLEELNYTFEKLKQNPFAFAKDFELVEVRKASISKFPYKIFYTINEEKNFVNVFAVFHSSRDPIIWKERFKHLT